MSSFSQMLSDIDLLGMSNLNSTDVASLLNKVNREEVESHDWSYLYTNVTIWGVPPYGAGTINLGNGSNVISGNGTSFTNNMGGWFLSVGATLTTPVLVSAVLTQSNLQLSAPWQGPTLSNQPYTIYPLYYDIYPIQVPFRVRQIDYLVQTSQEALARIDPSRISTGGNPCYRWAPAPWTNDTPPHYQIELWPRATAALPYFVDGKVGPIDMVNPNDQPQVPSQVIEAKACMYLCRGIFASTGNPKWMQMAEAYKDDFKAELDKAIIEDNRRKVTLGLTATGMWTGGINSGLDYWASHDAFGPPDYGY